MIIEVYASSVAVFVLVGVLVELLMAVSVVVIFVLVVVLVELFIAVLVVVILVCVVMVFVLGKVELNVVGDMETISKISCKVMIVI